MAEDSMLDKAMAMVPGVFKKKRRRSKSKTSVATHVANLKKGIARLTADVERLVGLVGKEAKRTSGSRTAPAKRGPGKRAQRGSRKAGKRTAPKRRATQKG